MEAPALQRVDDYRYLIPRRNGMLVEGMIFASPELLPVLQADKAPAQVRNVAHLPGIVGRSLAMPDIHWGYGFPIGGVAATRVRDGVISPGGVGYDINCGVRLVATNLEQHDVEQRLDLLADALLRDVPAGVGVGGAVKLSAKQLERVLAQGAAWAVKNGWGESADLERIESLGRLDNADPDRVSARAKQRGNDQLGTLGSGNHFIEINVVQQIHQPQIAQRFGLRLGQICLMIHSGSRGLGYQVCDDSLEAMGRYVVQHGLSIPDRQLAAAHFTSREGQDYFKAMCAAANYAFANRQVLMRLAVESIERALHVAPRELGAQLVYDVAHNIAKLETHAVEGKPQQLVVHRKGATRAFPAHAPDLPDCYRDTGHPVLIPGDMGTASYVLVGTQQGMEQTFGSTCHGAGRVLSRKGAIKRARGRSIREELAQRGIVVRSRGRSTLAEEMPEAYKDVDAVVAAVEGAGISRRVARLMPLAVIKG
ncbi:MAG: RtcB family protein [Candidatus Alcyoniella australis]|nr:RtcB family protein [Candidatus Alcyoniella australis]